MEIKEAWSKEEGVDYSKHVDLDRRYVCGMRYYGSYNGYTFLFSQGQLQMLCSVTVGDFEFKYNSSFTIYAYKDGQFYTLRQVYEAGEITDKHLE